MAPPLQVRLLRSLQEHEVTPVGSSVPVKFDARIIAATNRDLEKEVQAGNFREDLYYRLNVIEMTLPPLRERRQDIPALVRHFLSRAAERQSAVEKPISDEAMSSLRNYDWPGNVRELQNAVERALILSGDEIGLDDISPKIRVTTGVGEYSESGRPTLEDVERRYVLDTLESNGNDKVAAAKTLGIDLSTLYRKLKRYEEL
jgi:DNA-binding NtrC family response regulator